MGSRSKGCCKNCGKVIFFGLWLLLWLASIALLLWNVQWHIASITEIIMAVVIVIGLALLLIDVMEGMAMAIMTIFLFGRPRKERIGDSSRITAILNYNLLAYCKKDIDDCYERMYQAFLGNLSENISAVLVSVTPDVDLKRYELESRDKYRHFLRHTLYAEGKAFLKHETDAIEYVRLVNLWQKAETKYGRRYLKSNLEKFCHKICREFMCIHRVSKVLRKCGQYQDLMLLSDGYSNAFTYCEKKLYGPYARDAGEPLFYDTDDVKNILNRKYDYTFVLDGDTRVQPGVAHSLLNIAVTKPAKGIIQPSIKFEVTIWDTIYMHLEDLRSQLNEPMANCMPRVLGQCGFYGKALINNRIYIDSIIGHPNQVLEKVPVNVLSHDTYEAAILKPYYVSKISFVERPVYNYLAWNSRLRRWNLGDLILYTYFSSCFGTMIQSFQKCAQGKKYFHVRVRTPLKLDFVSSYISHSSIRAIFLKPFWCVFVIVYTAALGTKLYYRWVPIIVVMIIIVVFSKIPLLLRCSKAILYILPELLSSIIQFTAEIIVGFLRIIRVFHALVVGQKKQVWVPQRYIEEEFDTVNVWKIWVYSWKHLWGYAVFGLALIAVMIVLAVFNIIVPLIYILIIFDLATIAAIPLFCFITSLRICPCCRSKKDKDKDSDKSSSIYNPSTLGSTYRDIKDSTLLIDIDEKKPRRNVVKDEKIWIDQPEREDRYIEEVTITQKGQRRKTERIGSEDMYEEILVPINQTEREERNYYYIDGDESFDTFAKDRSKKYRKSEAYEIVEDWKTKDNPIYDETVDNEYVEVVESQPTVTQTVYRVNETQKQERNYSMPKRYVKREHVYGELQTPEEFGKEEELRDALKSLDSAISQTKQQRRVETDGSSTKFIKTKRIERSPVNLIDQKVSYIMEKEPKLVSGGRTDSEFSEYRVMRNPTESSRLVQERSLKSSNEQKSRTTASVELWSDKGTLSSMATDSTYVEKDEPIYEDMDVQTWLRANQENGVQRETITRYESIPLQNKTKPSTAESHRSYASENRSVQEKPTSRADGYIERYGPQSSQNEVVKQKTSSTYENAPWKTDETTHVVTRDSGQYQNVSSYGATSPTPVDVSKKPFTYGKIDDRYMSEGTLINTKLYENLSQWHKAMDKTMPTEPIIEPRQAERVMSTESTVSSRELKSPAPPPREDSLSFTTQRNFNIVPKERFDVRSEVIREEPAVSEYVSRNYTTAVSDSSGSEDELWTKKYSKQVTRDVPEVQPNIEKSYTVVTERSMSPQRLVSVERAASPRHHDSKYVSIIEENVVTPERQFSVERSVSPTRLVEVERSISPQRMVSVQRAASPRIHETREVVTERVNSPTRLVEVERSVSPQRLVSVERAASPRIHQIREVVTERPTSPQRLVTVKRVVSPVEHEYETSEVVTERRSMSPRGAVNSAFEDDSSTETRRYEERDGRTYEVIRRSVSPKNLEMPATDSVDGDVIVKTRKVRTHHEPRVENKKDIERSFNIVSESSVSTDRSSHFKKAAVTVEDTRVKGKGEVKLAFNNAYKAPGKAVEVGKRTGKQARDGVSDRYSSAKESIQDKVGDVSDGIGGSGIGSTHGDDDLTSDKKEKWMLNYEKKATKKAARAEKR